MRSLVSKKRLTIGAAVVFLFFSFNLISSQVRGLAISISSPLQTSFWRAGNAISTFFGGGSLRVENEALAQENFTLLQELVALRDLKKENEELRRMLDLGLAEEFDMAMGEIIAKDLAKDIIVIKAGQNKGVQKGMPVITGDKIAVGRVVESFSTHARVQLISAHESKVDASIAGAAATGVVRGQGGQKLMLDWVPQEDEFHVGDLVVTSSLGGLFPKDLLIGEVAEILKTGADPFQKADVKPFFNLKTAQMVFVITSFGL